jgi:predicted transposase YbfD/YdcC
MKMKKKKELITALKTIPDFRVDKHKIEYPLYEVLFLCLFGMLKGYVTYKSLHTWMEYQEENQLFQKLFEKESLCIPSCSTLHHIIINTDNNELERVFRDYFFPYIKLESISVDGKWLNGSDINGQYTQSGHKSIFNILDKEKKLIVAHKFMEKGKLSEIPAFEELLADERFAKEGQIFSFDALLTQVEILNTINDSNRRYIAKIKGNQKELLQKACETIELFKEATQKYSSEHPSKEDNKIVKRDIEVYESDECNIVMFHKSFKNIQTLIKLTKEIYDTLTGEVTISTSYFIANFKSNGEFFYHSILRHWDIETYHYHLDMLTKEDKHIAYINPFSMSILRSFVINLYQLYFNANEGKKIKRAKVSMVEIQRACHHMDSFTSDILEMGV